MNLTKAAYKVSLKKGLSKAYTLEKLRRARDAGQVTDLDLCTADEGENFYKLGELLSYAEALAVQSAVQEQPDETSTDSDMEKSVYGFQPVFEPQDPSLRSSASSVQSSRSAVQSGSMVHERSAVRSAVAGPTQSSDDSSYLGGPAAAEDALNSALIRRRKAREAAERSSVTEAADFIGDIGSPIGGNNTYRSLLAGCAGGMLTALLCAAAWFAVGPKSDSELVLASVFKNADVAPVVNDSKFEPMSLDELSVRVRIMNAQLKQVAKSASVNVEAVTASNLEALSRRKIELLPFLPVRLGSKDRSELDRIFEQYVELVQANGPDGRNIDPQTVDLFSERLIQLISQPGNNGDSRKEAAHDAGEKCKLLYLLQLGKLKSKSLARQLEAQTTMQTAVRAAIDRLYLECAAGDATFQDVFEAAPAEEQQELLLIRYWYYRSVDPTTASSWIKGLLQENAEVSAGEVNSSIAEVDAIVDG